MRAPQCQAVATILNEIARGVGVLVREEDIPVRAEVRSAAELLGIDPMYVACEGAPGCRGRRGQADGALAVLGAYPPGAQASVIGQVTSDQPGIVLLKTAFGGTRIVDLLISDGRLPCVTGLQHQAIPAAARNHPRFHARGDTRD